MQGHELGEIRLQVHSGPPAGRKMRARAIRLHNQHIPDWLEPGRTTKLRNTLAYWDASRSTVWLRARGFNFFRVAGAVAKLNLDEGNRSIVGEEIRFSVGIPVIFVLFFVSAYLMFSETLPTGSQVPSPCGPYVTVQSPGLGRS